MAGKLRNLFCAALVALLAFPSAALANHTDPREPLSSTDDPGTTELLTEGEGTWEFIANFPPNPGTDLKFFKKRGQLFAGAGTLGQADEQSVGQRFIRLVNRKGEVKPIWVADHGSANCPTANPAGTTGLQHDIAVTPKRNPKLAIDSTDATGRCHDSGGGGLELIDISKLHRKKFKPREVHLTRHEGTSHTVTADPRRPWIVYNGSSQTTGAPYIDVLNIKSCLTRKAKTLKQKRRACRPKVYRIVFNPEWAQQIDTSGERMEGTESSCHDIEMRGSLLYCANLNSSIVLNVAGLTKPKGAVKGTPLNCEVIAGTETKAKVTDCSNVETIGEGQATGWEYVGHVNHPGRNGTHNTNTDVESAEGVAVSHEAEPTYDGDWMFVTDERGGGIVPGGSSCAPETPNPYGNGGVHVFDISQPGEFPYALQPDDSKAVFIGNPVVPATTFCTAHVMQQQGGEQRFAIAWYSQGTKIVDWFVDGNGRWTFRETASAVPQGPAATTWVSQVFKKVDNEDGTRTYYFMTSDITRGIDIMSWTGPTNPIGTPPPPPAAAESPQRAGLAAPAVLLLLLVFLILKRRRTG